MTEFVVVYQGQKTQDVSADEFRIEEGGVLTFYESSDTDVTRNKKPHISFNEWRSVREK